MLLAKLITKETIQLNVAAMSWEEAIKMGGDILIRNRAVDSAYVNAMIKNTIENGPYFVLVPGIAIPHARCDQGVKKLGMSLITLNKPIDFFDSPNNPVKIVICLAAEDNFTHLDILKELTGFLSNKEDIEAIINADFIDQALEVFQRY